MVCEKSAFAVLSGMMALPEPKTPQGTASARPRNACLAPYGVSGFWTHRGAQQKCLCKELLCHTLRCFGPLRSSTYRSVQQKLSFHRPFLQNVWRFRLAFCESDLFGVWVGKSPVPVAGPGGRFPARPPVRPGRPPALPQKKRCTEPCQDEEPPTMKLAWGFECRELAEK